MRRGRSRGVCAGEGLILAVALCLALIFALESGLNRLLRVETVAPVHSVSEEVLKRAAMIDLNTAAAAELEQLPGIGSVLAGRIVAYREEHGPFASVEELMDVYGIGPVRLEAIRDMVFVD